MLLERHDRENGHYDRGNGHQNVSFGMPGTQWCPNFNKCKEAMLRAARVCPPASVYVCTYLYIFLNMLESYSLYNPPKGPKRVRNCTAWGLRPPGGPLSHYKNRGV